MQKQTQLLPTFSKILIDHGFELSQIVKSESFNPVFHDYEKILVRLNEKNLQNFSKKLNGRIPANTSEQRRWLEFYNVLDELIALDDLWNRFNIEPTLIDEDSIAGQSPDLKVAVSSKLILAEVKHIDHSDKELKHIDQIIKSEQEGKRQKTYIVEELEQGFFNKFCEWVEKAKQQFDSYNSNADANIVYMFIRPDRSAVVDAFGPNLIKTQTEKMSKELKSEKIGLVTYSCSFSISPSAKRHRKTCLCCLKRIPF